MQKIILFKNNALVFFYCRSAGVRSGACRKTVMGR